MTIQSKKVRRLPDWFKVPLPGLGQYASVCSILEKKGLHTVCQSARCPNIGECFGSGTATFLIMGPRCTRFCRFCNIEGGTPAPIDLTEPERVAEAVASLGIQHAVITSVTRDDLDDGGAAMFAATIEAIRRICLETTIEVLIPDFQGNSAALQVVLEAGPDILNHNVETVPRLYSLVRPQASYRQSLELLERSFELAPTLPVKSGFMVGLGELHPEIISLLHDLHQSHCSIVTIGQYLSPSGQHIPVERYYSPDEFSSLAFLAREIGFREVYSAPLVRSSYHAHPAQ